MTDLGEGRCVRATERALYVELESGEARWIPRSVIHDDSEVYDDDENASGKVVVQDWWAAKEGLG